jgi:hypothetical protein
MTHSYAGKIARLRLAGDFEPVLAQRTDTQRGHAACSAFLSWRALELDSNLRQARPSRRNAKPGTASDRMRGKIQHDAMPGSRVLPHADKA